MNTTLAKCDVGDSLRIFEDARREIAGAQTVEAVNRILALATGLAAAARQATDKEMEAEAAALKLEAERRLGQLMAAQKETVGLNTGTAGKGRPKLSGFPDNPPKIDDRPTLAEAGVDKNLAHRARTAAALPETEFKEAVEVKRKAVLTRTRARRRSTKQVQDQHADNTTSYICTMIASTLDAKNIDAVVDCLLTKRLDDLIEFARHPKFNAIAAAVMAKLGGNKPGDVKAERSNDVPTEQSADEMKEKMAALAAGSDETEMRDET